MADRSFHVPEVQGIKHVTYHLTVAGANPTTNAATFVEGDTLSASVGSYVVSTKVATGKYRFKTTNPFIGCVAALACVQMATPTGNQYCEVLKPSQNADKTWQFEVWVYTNAAGTFSLADIAAADQISVTWTLRNSNVRP